MTTRPGAPGVDGPGSVMSLPRSFTRVTIYSTDEEGRIEAILVTGVQPESDYERECCEWDFQQWEQSPLWMSLGTKLGKIGPIS